MKEYKTGSDFYAFELEPYVIEADLTGIENVFVQEEKYDEYLELNPSLEGILRKRNFLLKAVQVTEWEEAMRAPEPVSIVVDTDTVNVEYASPEGGYAFTAKSFATSPTGYEEYVTITVVRGDGYVYDEYEEGMLLTINTYTITYSLEDGDGYIGDTASYTVNVEITDEPISIIVDTTPVSVEYENGGEGYSFTAKSFTTSPAAMNDYVAITVGGNEYSEGMLLAEGTYTVTYSMIEHDFYVGEPVSYTITVTEASAEPTSVSIVVDTESVEETCEYGEGGYAFVPKEYSTDPVGYEEYVTVTVGESEYYEGMLLVEGTYTVTYTLEDGDGYVGDTASYTITVTEAEPVPEPTEVTIVVDTTDDSVTEIEGTTMHYYTARSFTTSPTGYENDVVVSATLEETSETIEPDGMNGFDIESLPAGNYTITVSYNLEADQEGTHTSASETYTAYLTIESAAPSYTLTYTYNDNYMTATCTGMEESASDTSITEITIPSTVVKDGNTYIVKTIGQEAFKNYTYLQHVILPDLYADGYTSQNLALFDYSFYNSGLTEIYIPKNISNENLWNNQFANTPLERIEIANGTWIGRSYMFANCNNLENIILHQTTPPTFVLTKTFNNSDLTSCTLHVPEGTLSAYQSSDWGSLSWDDIVDDIPLLNYEFDEDNNTVAITGTDYPLTVINIPKTVTKDNTTYTVNSVDGFSGKTSIEEVNFPTYVSGDDDITVGINAFSGTHVTSVHIPENIVSSGYAFSGCSLLEEVMIEDGSYNFGAADFGQSAGSNLSPLRTFVLKHTTPPNVSSDLFFNTNVNDCILYVPVGTLSDYEASNWNNLGFYSIEEGEGPITIQAEFDPAFGSVDDPQPLEIDITNQQQTYGPGNAVFDLSDIPLPTVTCNDTQGWHWTCEIIGQTSGNVITVNTTVTNGAPVVTGSTNPNDGLTYQSVPCDLTDTWTIEYYFETESNDDGGMPLASDSRSIEIQFINQS